jgi:thiamine kinase
VTELINPFEALALVPGWDPDATDIEELKGGLTNRTYYIKQDDMQCVMRLDSERSRIFQFDRSAELRILAEAGKAGLAPEVRFADVNAGILVTEYLPGRVWQETDLDCTENLESLAKLLREVHALPRSGLRVDMTDIARTYETHLEKRHGLHAYANRCVEIISSLPSRGEAVCCHNDIVAANIVSGDDLQLIDWEFSCDNDPLFDLASAIGFHNLDDNKATVLLSAYAGGDDAELKERLAEQVRVFDAIQWLWLATLHLFSPKRWQAQRLEELQQRIG